MALLLFLAISLVIDFNNIVLQSHWFKGVVTQKDFFYPGEVVRQIKSNKY